MQHLKKIFFILLFAAAFFPSQTFASHAMGSDISYECLGGSQYRITLTFYRDCNGILASSTAPITYSSASCSLAEVTVYLNQLSAVEVSPLCPTALPNSACNGGVYPGVEQYVYEGIITLPAQCSDWIISYRECCRNPAITNLVNAQNFNLYVYATINNLNGLCDNSPIFTTPPVPYTCGGLSYSYNQGAVDIDGDSLVYELVQPLHDDNVYIAYAGSFTPNQPLSTIGAFNFNSATGQISFTPATTAQSAVISVRVTSYRNGVVVGSTMRDIQVVLLSGFFCSNESPNIGTIRNLTGASFIDSFSVQLCPGSSLSFDIPVTDPNGDSIQLISNNQTAIPGSVFTVIGTGAAVTGRFSWTPTTNDVGFFPFQITYKDNGCPASAPQTTTYVVRVFDKVYAGADQVYCGDPIQLQAYGGSYFVWTPATGLTNDSISNPLATPTAPTFYTVTNNCGTDTVFVGIQQGYNLDAGSDASICLNGLAHITPTVSASGAPYTYTWSPAAGLSDTTTANVFASPNATTTYILTAVSAQGCVKKDSITISISGISPAVRALAVKDTACFGEQVQLDMIVTPSACGTTPISCTGQPVLLTAGTGTNSTGVGTPYKGYWEDGRVQYLYRASELNTLGFSGGTITGLSFNVATKGSTSPYNGFTIRMGCTSANELTSFLPGLSVVKSPAAYTTVPGWNYHPFTAGYDWDGVSNLVIEVCFNNYLTASDDDDVAYTTMPFKCTAYDFADDPAGGCTLAFATTGRNRPNMQLTVCTKPITNGQISWTPAGNLSNPNIANPVAQLFSTTTFIASYDAGGCVGRDVLTVVVDSTIYVQTIGDTSFCAQAAVQLGATVFGTPGGYPRLNCGISGTACGTTSDTITIGSGTTISTGADPFNGNFHDGKVQYLYTAAEIIAMGGADRIFKEIAVDVGFKNSTGQFKNFTIQMGCTNLTAFSGSTFATSLSTVYGPVDITTIAGWNTFALLQLYEWDGVSNIIIQFCFNNTAYVQNDFVNGTTLPHPMAMYASADFDAGCNLTLATLSNFRANIRLGFCYPPVQTTFSYAWSPATGLSNPNILNPTANPDTTTEYTLTVRGGVCEVADNVKVSVGLNVNIFELGPVCAGSSTGTVVAQPESGTPPYTFQWNTGVTNAGRLTDTLSNLGPGIYRVIVTDAIACVDTGTITVVSSPQMQATLNGLLTCSDDVTGSITAIITGGTRPYSFSWSNGVSSGAQLSDTLRNLSEGNYTVTVNDSVGCSKVFSTALSPLSDMEINHTIQNPDCYNGSNGNITISVSGGRAPYNYYWNTGETTQNRDDIPQGVYLLTVIDLLNCSKVDSMYVIEPAELVIDSIYITDAGCNQCSNGGISIAASGGTPPYEYSVDNVNYRSDSSFASLTPNMYGVRVRDANGCIESSFAQVDFFDGIPSIDEQASLQVYPNPAKDFITVAMQLQSARKIELSIKSVLGKEVYVKTYGAQQSLNEKISMKEYAAGVYLVVVKVDASVLYKKLIVE